MYDRVAAHADVSVTAFIVNESRARLESLSLDRYAKLWVTDEVRRLWSEFAREVYPYDDVNLSVRNRFYLEHVQKFVADCPGAVFVNPGAGFTSYPYLLDEAASVRCIEADYAHIVEYKNAKAREFQRRGLLPERTVERYSLDMNLPEELSRFKTDFRSWCADTPAVVLMEGLTYYLSPATLDRLFDMYGKFLLPGSLVLFDFWGPDMNESPVLQRTRQYLSRISGTPPMDFTPMEIEAVGLLPGLEPAEHTDIAELEQRYAQTRVFRNPANCFPTEFAVLRKT